MASPAIPGLFFCFAAMVLLIFVSVSTPTWNSVNFLTTNQGASPGIRYGVFGFTGSKTAIGYFFQGVNNLNTTIIHNLTKTLILHPIAAGLSGIAVILGLFGATRFRLGTVLMAICAALALLVVLVAFVIDMVLFGIARNHYRSQGFRAQYGNANWLTLGALVALLLGFCTSACGSLRRHDRRGYV